VYYGEEIGMRNISLRRDQIMDPPGKKFWPFYKGRDGYRSPMQWDDSEHAGFSSAKPWLPVHPNYRARNVEAQQQDPSSLLNFAKEVILLRREKPALHRGDFTLLTSRPRDTLVYTRQIPEQTILVALNFKDCPVIVREIPQGKWKLLLSTVRDASEWSVAELPTEHVQLAPFEVLILESA
jgi:alpha-glucosidase